ncbi:hypothetical protein [Moraxella nasicaprae]|uniref:Transposase n=1 Tax=Moraxella nasicaprae TaxID=2904122 RepID=A0ABY6F3U0_9GAMM|nr:hypothetical protein [Moraxella nasicaprae]UXZ04733.1 hypothetical protein LU297_09255 [Moraxella nasicaprae]
MDKNLAIRLTIMDTLCLMGLTKHHQTNKKFWFWFKKYATKKTVRGELVKPLLSSQPQAS